MLSVTVPDEPPPVKPDPAVTPSISPASLVKLITPVELLYDKSPPALIKPRTSASVLSVKLITPVVLLYATSPLALRCALTCDALGPVL